MTTENTAAKGVADRMLRSRQIAVNRHRNRTRARIGISSEIGLYLALNWQRIEIGLRHPSADRRFPTPLRTQNAGDIEHENGPSVTTHHVLSQLARVFPVPISRPNSGVRCHARNKASAGGGRGQPNAAGEGAVSIRTHRIFYTNGSPALFCDFKKTPGRNGDAQRQPRQLTPSRELATNH